jgi:hypothetical protein
VVGGSGGCAIPFPRSEPVALTVRAAKRPALDAPEPEPVPNARCLAASQPVAQHLTGSDPDSHREGGPDPLRAAGAE